MSRRRVPQQPPQPPRLAQWLLPALGLVVLVVANHRLVAPLEQLPSPLFGGDYYYQLGQTNHVASGGSPLASATVTGTLPVYFIVYSGIAGWMTRIIGNDAISTTLFLTYAIAVASYFAMLWLCRGFGASWTAAAFAGFMFAIGQSLLVIKYTPFTAVVVMPLFLACLHRFRTHRSWRWAVALGLAYGILSLSHGIGFIGGSLLVAMMALYDHRVIFRGWVKRDTLLYGIASTLGIAIALLYWWRPIFVYWFQPESHFFQIEIVGDPARLWGWFKDHFLSVGDLQARLSVGLRWLGVVALVWNGSATRQWMPYLVATLMFAFHDILTFPLFGFHLVPSRSGLFLNAAMPVLVALGADKLAGVLRLFWLRGLAVAVACILFVVIGNRSVDAMTRDQWYAKGKTPLRKPYDEAAAFLRQNSDVHDTILTTKELGFALNALSGRKLVSVRRGQADSFFDMDPVDIDYALMLYGNEKTDRRALLRKHAVKFLYWDDYWIGSEYHINGGKVMGTFDPVFLYHSTEKESVLREYDVSYYVENTWPDPANRGAGLATFDLIFVGPQNYRSAEQPWHPALDPYLSAVWRYEEAGRTRAVLYRIVDGSGS